MANMERMISWQADAKKMAYVRRLQGLGLRDFERQADMERMNLYRYNRLQEQLANHDCAAALLMGSANVRYATGTRFAQIFNMRSPFRAVFIPAEGKSILYDWEGYSQHAMPAMIAERRDAQVSSYWYAGGKSTEVANNWAREIAEELARIDKTNKRIALDIAEPHVVLALAAAGLDVIAGTELVEKAASIKNEDEIFCMAATAAIAETGLAKIREELRPGITEQALWAHLHHVNAEAGGEWIEYRLAGSGGRTNPWGQEVSDKIIRAGELFGIDTGMIGPFGYGADISRTFHCKPGRPTDEQRRLYTAAVENIAFNIAMVRPGLSFEEFSKSSWPTPEEFKARSYAMVSHGLGMGDAWPSIPHPQHWDAIGYDGELRENMVITIESCIGREDGLECVKLEEMVIVREDGCQLLSAFPFEDDLMN